MDAFLARSPAAPPRLAADAGFRAELAHAYAALGGAEPLGALAHAADAV